MMQYFKENLGCWDSGTRDRVFKGSGQGDLQGQVLVVWRSRIVIMEKLQAFSMSRSPRPKWVTYWAHVFVCCNTKGSCGGVMSVRQHCLPSTLPLSVRQQAPPHINAASHSTAVTTTKLRDACACLLSVTSQRNKFPLASNDVTGADADSFIRLMAAGFLRL